MDKQYEHIDINKFSTNVFSQFKIHIQEDNSVLLVRWDKEATQEPTCNLVRKYYGGTKVYEVSIPPEKSEIAAVVVVMRTSTNHYAVVGSRKEYTKSGYGKTVGEVSDFITRWFCHTLFNETKGE